MSSRRPSIQNDDDDGGEIVAQSAVEKLLSTFKLYIIRPFLMGLSGAFGVSMGYAAYDYVIKKWWNF